MQKLYIDIETTATSHNAGIWQIGLVMENPNQTFFRECVPDGYSSDSTIKRIESQPSVFSEYKRACNCNLSQKEALKQLVTFLKTNNFKKDRNTTIVYSWGNFDIPIIEFNLDPSIEPPWHYGSVCDVRSAAKFLNSSIRPDTSTHNALDDALSLQKCVNQLENKIL